MYLCSKYHEEIAFEEKSCPLCEKIKEYDKELEIKNEEIIKLTGDSESVRFSLKEVESSLEEVTNELETSKKDLRLTRDGQQDGQR